MKKSMVALLLLFPLSTHSQSTLLTSEDWKYQFNHGQIAELGSAIEEVESWESFNQWLCFSNQQIEFLCAVYDENTLVPSLFIENAYGIFLIDAHVEDRLDCQDTIEHWKELASSNPDICVFAAHMPQVKFDDESKKPRNLFYIKRLKTSLGYWDAY